MLRLDPRVAVPFIKAVGAFAYDVRAYAYRRYAAFEDHALRRCEQSGTDAFATVLLGDHKPLNFARSLPYEIVSHGNDHEAYDIAVCGRDEHLRLVPHLFEAPADLVTTGRISELREEGHEGIGIFRMRRALVSELRQRRYRLRGDLRSNRRARDRPRLPPLDARPNRDRHR